jgi:hypothetical protein
LGWFIFALIFALLGATALVIRSKVTYPDPTDYDRDSYLRRDLQSAQYMRLTLLITGVVMLFLSALTITLDSWVRIPPRNVGVQIHLGKAVAALPNGWHLVPPYDSVEVIDASVQTMVRSSDTGNCVQVRLANQTTACVDVTVQWNIDHTGNVVDLYNKYRSGKGVFHNVEANVVERKLSQQVLPEIFATFNPLAVITDAGTQVNPTSFSGQALARMRQVVDSGINVDSLTLGLTHYDTVTQEKLNAFAQALADTRIATQQKLTSEQQKLANKNLVDASSNDPGVKYQNCLNFLRELAAKNQLQNLQYGGFACSSGSTNQVIVGQR